MLVEEIIHKKYGLNGYNNPTDFFCGMMKKLKPRKDKTSRIYFLDLPEHGNMGDQAIAFAMVNLVKNMSERYELISFPISYLLRSLCAIKKDCKKDDIFILIGGGNMGIEYFPNEETRRIIIKMFPKNRIIIFPQTIDYGNTEQGQIELKKTIKIYSQHKDLHIFAREKKSYEIMLRNFRHNNIYLIPDMVYSLQYNKKMERQYILSCIRKDRESSLSHAEYTSIKSLLRKYGNLKEIDTVDSTVPIISSERIRKILVYRKLDVFAGAKYVVTDRLHGMIFSVITHTPCFVFSNYNHKLSSSYKTWLQQNPNVFFIRNIDELSEALKKIDTICEDNNTLSYIRNQYGDLEKLF